MPSIINASAASTGLLQSADASGILQLQSNGTTGLTIGNTANVIVDTNLFVSGSEVEPLVLGTAQATTSGTSRDFTGIPSWVKRITLMFSGVSGSGTSPLVCQIGTTSGITTTGYFSVYQGINTSGGTSSVAILTTSFGLMGGLAATDICYGNVILSTMGNNIWTITGTVARDSATDAVYMTSGSVTLSGILDRLRFTWSNGTDTFDAGSVNIMYE